MITASEPGTVFALGMWCCDTGISVVPAIMETVIKESQNKCVTTHCKKDYEGKSRGIIYNVAIMEVLTRLEQNHSKAS